MEDHAVNPAISPNMTVVSGNKSAIGLALPSWLNPDFPSFKKVLIRSLDGSTDLAAFESSFGNNRSRTFEGNNEETIAED